jgi:peptidoglycan hydrolase-like protein with peptidoglycan-binding domain
MSYGVHREATRLLIGIARDLGAGGAAPSFVSGADDLAAPQECAAFGGPRAERDADNPRSGLPPLVYDAPRARQDLQSKRRRRPTVGFAQRHLNRFLAELDRRGAGAICAAPDVVQELRSQIHVPLLVDCVFGPQTTLATRAFQACRGLTVDGRLGPSTWRALLGFPSAVGLSFPTSPATASRVVVGQTAKPKRQAQAKKGAFATEVSLVATFRRPRAWKTFGTAEGDAIELKLLKKGTWHPTSDDMRLVANVPNQGTMRTEVIDISNMNGLIASIIKRPNGQDRANGSIRRLNIISHGNPGVIGLTGDVDDDGGISFRSSGTQDLLDSETLDAFSLSRLNDEGCALRDQARAKFDPAGEIALILCNGGLGSGLALMQDLSRVFNVRVLGYRDEILFHPQKDRSGTRIVQRDLTALGPDSPDGRGYPCIVTVPPELAGTHLPFTRNQPKPSVPFACVAQP